MKLRPAHALSREDLNGSAASVLSEEEWRALCDVFGDAIECAIDHAAMRSQCDSDDVGALHHLRHVARAMLAGRPVAADTGALLQAVGILLTTLAEPTRDVGTSGQRLPLVGGRVRQLSAVSPEEHRASQAPSLVEVPASATSTADRIRPARRTSARRAPSLSVAA